MFSLRTARFVSLLTLVLAAPAAAAALPRPSASRPALPPVPAEIVVALPAGEAFGVGEAGEPRVLDAARAALLAREGLAPARLLGCGGARAGRAALGTRFALLRLARPGADAAAAAGALRASGLFAAACPNVRARLFATYPNDPLLPDQWWVHDDTGADVRLPEAWDITHGSTSVAIAILDTGVDTGHPDLASRIWTNPGEIAGNGLDDDGNGYVDDVHGWDFGGGDNDPNPEAMIDEIGLDEGFHGTMCAGIASAATHNSEGIAGAGWNSRILPLRIFDSSGGASAASIADAVAYATDNGADVISMSFGAAGDPGVPEFFQELIDAANAAGVVCVAAAGNDGVDTPEYPAACAHVISVGATTSDNQRAEFSNWGPTVDVAAPGSFMLSALCRNYVIDDLSQIFYIYFFYWDGETPYMFADGTSFSAPLVAGVCALVRSQHPTLGSDAMRDLLHATGDGVAYDEPIGRRVNAYRALTTSTAVGPAVASGTALAAPWPNPSAGLTRLAFSLARAGEAELAMFDAAGRRVRTLATGACAAGAHDAEWDGCDAQGRPVPAGLYFARFSAGGVRQVARVARLPR